MKDNFGNTYAYYEDINPGDIVLVDGGFSCMAPWSLKEVFEDEEGELYLICDEGRHYLFEDEFVEDGSTAIVGVYLPRVILSYY